MIDYAKLIVLYSWLIKQYLSHPNSSNRELLSKQIDLIGELLCRKNVD